MFNKTKKHLHTLLPKARLTHAKQADIIASSLLACSLAGLSVIVALSLGTHPTNTLKIPVPDMSPMPPLSDSTSGAQVIKSPQLQPQLPTPAESVSLVKKSQSQPELILRFSSQSALDDFMDANSLKWNQIEAIPLLNAYKVQATSPTLTEGASQLENNQYQSLLTPTDPSYASQWYLPSINAPESWNHQQGNASVLTAIIDTGYSLTHEDLSSKWKIHLPESGTTLLEGPIPNCTSRDLPLDKQCNNIDDDNNGYVDDYLGWNFVLDSNNVQAGQTSPASAAATHGTLVSGLVGATPNNEKGISGVNWNGSLLPIQALDDTGSGTTLSVALSVRYAVDQGAKVINLSLGSQSADTLLSEQIQYAISQGVSVVAASGNDGCSCILYPARYPGVISVGSVDSTLAKASYSSFGSTLSLVSPGSSICSTDWSPSNASRYTCGHNGTSFASPLVAGAVGILRSQSPTLSSAEIKSALLAGTTKLPQMGGQTRTDNYGDGLLNIQKSLELSSAPMPQGAVVNTHIISLTAENTSRQTDSFNTTCTSSQSQNCHVRAIHSVTNEVVDLDDDTPTSSFNYYWTAAEKNLAAGIWHIQIYATDGTSQSLVREDSVSISP